MKNSLQTKTRREISQFSKNATNCLWIPWKAFLENRKKQDCLK